MIGKFGSAAEEMEVFVREQKRLAALKAASEPPSSDKKKLKKEAKKKKKEAADQKKKKPPQAPTSKVASSSVKDDKGSEKQLSKRLSTKLFKKKKNSSSQEQELEGSESGDNPQPSTTTEERSEEDLAMDKIRLTIDRQEKREIDLQNKMQNLIAEAKKKLSAGDKKGAIFAMKRKKFFEDELDKLQNAKFTMETQILKIESAIENREMYEAMATGSNTMKKLQIDVGIDEVDTVMENIREEMELALEINDAIVQDVNPSAFDEDALLAELTSMDQPRIEVELPYTIPHAPTTTIEPECYTADPHRENSRQKGEKWGFAYFSS